MFETGQRVKLIGAYCSFINNGDIGIVEADYTTYVLVNFPKYPHCQVNRVNLQLVENMFQQSQQVKVIGRKYSAGQDMVGQIVTLLKIYDQSYSTNGWRGVLWEVQFNGSKEYAYEDDLQLINNNTMDKFYRVLKETPTLGVGAILKKESDGSYKPTDDIWNFTETVELTKYLDKGIAYAIEAIENSPSWYERVWKYSSFKGMVYVTKAKMQELMSKTVVNKDGDATGDEK